MALSVKFGTLIEPFIVQWIKHWLFALVFGLYARWKQNSLNIVLRWFNDFKTYASFSIILKIPWLV